MPTGFIDSNENFLNWCFDSLKGCEWKDCDESQHLYLNGEMLGGYAGDTRQHFICNDAEGYAKARRMFLTCHDEPANEREMYLAVLAEDMEEPEDEEY